MPEDTPPAEAPVDTSAPAPEAAPGSVDTPAPVAPQLEVPPAPTPPAEAPVEEPPAPGVGSNPPDATAGSPQPALPVQVFGEHGAAGAPDAATVPAVKKGVYVDTDGIKHQVEIVASRKDGSVDILLPAGVGNIRRDGVRRRTTDEQTTDYLE